MTLEEILAAYDELSDIEKKTFLETNKETLLSLSMTEREMNECLSEATEEDLVDMAEASGVTAAELLTTILDECGSLEDVQDYVDSSVDYQDYLDYLDSYEEQE